LRQIARNNEIYPLDYLQDNIKGFEQNLGIATGQNYFHQFHVSG